MPTPLYVHLETKTLASDAAAVTFSSIPSTSGGAPLRDLVLVVTGTTATSKDVETRINGLSTAIYNSVSMYGDGSYAQSAALSNQTLLKLANEARFVSSAESSVVATFFDYAATDKHKSVLARSDSASLATEAVAGRIATTSAITSVEVLTQSGGVYVTGTTFTLYATVGE